MAQSVKRLTPGFSSGHDLILHEFEPCIGLCASSMNPAWTSLSICLSASLSLSLKINKLKKKRSPWNGKREYWIDEK